MRALLLLLIAFSSSAQSIPPPLTVTRPVTNGTVMLSWKRGDPYYNSVSNVTTGTVIASGEFEYYMVEGMEMGSTNVFVAFNESGLSNMATGIAGAYIPKVQISIYSYLVTVPAKTNGVTTILTSTNMSIWTKVESVTNAGPTHALVWTNDGASRFFRSVSQ